MNDNELHLSGGYFPKIKTGSKKPFKLIWLLYIVLFAYMFYALYPLVWLAFSSLKTNNEFLTSPWGIPSNPQWKNYIDAWSIGKVGQYFFNSIFVSLTSVVLAVLFSSMAAFALTRMRWKFQDTTLTIFLSGIMIPGHAILVSLFSIIKGLGIYNTYFNYNIGDSNYYKLSLDVE